MVKEQSVVLVQHQVLPMIGFVHEALYNLLRKKQN